MPAVIDHPILGTLTYDASVDAWRSSYGLGTFGFLIAGANVPDPELTTRAAEVKQNAAGFLKVVKQFLMDEAVGQPRWADEIRGLTVQEVCLFWPARPSDGMLYFSTANDSGRIWHADYINRAPIGLTFDS